jgi:tellurite resistance protein
MNVVTISRAKQIAESLEVLDSLRKQVESGEVVMFIAVGVTPADGTLQWRGTDGSKSRLQMLGAVVDLLRGLALE